MNALQIDDPRVGDLSASAKLVYLHVKADGPVSQHEIVERAQIPSGTVSRVADDLIDHGIINRMRDPNDLRSVVYDLVDREHPFAPSESDDVGPADYERFLKNQRG